MSYSERIFTTHSKELTLNHSSYKILITAVNGVGSSPASVIGISEEPENSESCLFAFDFKVNVDGVIELCG